VLATPVNPDPSPTKLDAVTIPENVALPLAAMVAAVPTFTAVAIAVPVIVIPVFVVLIFSTLLNHKPADLSLV